MGSTSELALTAKDIGTNKADFYVVLITAGPAMWNMPAAFVVGAALHWFLKRGWLRIQDRYQA